MDETRVAAVVTTYNRKDMLFGCLSALLNQSAPVVKVFLINNASTDGTDEALRKSGLLDDPRIVYRRMAENTGGSGGFHAGLKAAIETDANWFWLMDDDVAPEHDCLEKLLQFRSISECIHPVVAYEDGSVHEWEHLFDPTSTRQIGLMNASFRNGKEWCSVHVACFEGMLISRRIVDLIGLPDREFFVYGDDGLYGFKASRYTNVIYIRAGRMVKKIKPTGQITPFRMYYDLRNRFLLRRKAAQYAEVPGYTRYTFGLFLLIYTAALVHRSFSYRTIVAAVLAWWDGLRGVTGRARY